MNEIKKFICKFRGSKFNIFHPSAKRGFSLVETAAIVSIAAFAAVTAVTFNRSNVSNDASKLSVTVNRMNTIMESLDRFRSEHNRMPCPADPYLLTGNVRAPGAPLTQYVSGYGMENLDMIQTDGTLGIDCPIKEGMVPINELGLNDSFANDGWGRRFAYHVSSTLCGSNASATVGCTPSDYRNNKGIITVKSDTGSAITSEAAFVLVSYGSNGSGAFSSAGVKQTASKNANETENSNGDDIFVTANSSSSFDDIVRYKTKNMIDGVTIENARPLITPSACEDASAALASLNLTKTNQLRISVTDLPAIDEGNPGDSAVIDLFWTLQQVCRSYYGLGKAEWKGPRCPGGAAYDDDNQTCNCTNASWSGKC